MHKGPPAQPGVFHVRGGHTEKRTNRPRPAPGQPEGRCGLKDLSGRPGQSRGDPQATPGIRGGPSPKMA